MAENKTATIVKTTTKPKNQPSDVLLERFGDNILDEISSRLQSDKDSVRDQVKDVEG